MIVFLVVSVILLAGAAVAATLGRMGRTGLQLHPPASSIGGVIPAGGAPVRGRDIDNIRFDVAVRGYRMDQVDAVLGQLRTTIEDLEARAGRAESSSREPATNLYRPAEGIAGRERVSVEDSPRTAPASGASVHAFPRRERGTERLDEKE